MAEPTPPLLNPSPKQQFIASSNRTKAHWELISNPQMQDSINASLLHYQLLLSVNMTDANAAAANSFKIKGVLEFIEVFLKLAVEAQQLDRPKLAVLDHKA
jgi:hypothetical protein